MCINSKRPLWEKYFLLQAEVLVKYYNIDRKNVFLNFSSIMHNPCTENESKKYVFLRLTNRNMNMYNILPHVSEYFKSLQLDI